MKRKRVAIIISGRGSNMAALIRATKNDPSYPAKIVLVVSNRPDAVGIDLAKGLGVQVEVVDHKLFQNREAFERELDAVLKAHRVELVCLAGFMRLLTRWFVDRWKWKILNIHPALLPNFKGLHTHERAIESHARYHGASVHFVTPEMDSGPVLAKMPVQVRESDTPETLAGRVLKIEHRLYPAAIKLVAEGRVRISKGKCVVNGKATCESALGAENVNIDIGDPRRAVLPWRRARVFHKADKSKRHGILVPAE
jgi:phosphoribosylglycinamide formyltransferase-1